MARYLIGAGRILDDVTLEAEVGADEDERRADEEPEGEHGEQGEEGHGGGGLVGPQHQVEHEEGGEDKARAQQGAKQDTTDTQWQLVIVKELVLLLLLFISNLHLEGDEYIQGVYDKVARFECE